MNIQSGKMRTADSRTGNRQPSVGRRAAAIVKLLCVLVLAGGLANAYIYLTQKITETDREIRKTQHEIHLVDRELDSLRVRREKFTAWPHIRDSIAKYNLKLHLAEPGQIRSLALIPPALAPNVSVASRAAGQGGIRTAARTVDRGVRQQ
ncbi:MAG: hypothetical protein IJC73_04960 [Lentisphaeria bacterium]|nr:hypothetical protein [Lentisphaeria bacterium]